MATHRWKNEHMEAWIDDAGYLIVVTNYNAIPAPREAYTATDTLRPVGDKE